jgi:poly-beta-1,6-N-acetyl-D-glucosamine synthase
MTLIYYIFGISIFLILYTYAFYPFLLILLDKLFSTPDYRFNGSTIHDLPTVSIIVAAYNEESVIEKKIENFKQLLYPREKIDLLIGSDGSTDATSAKVRPHCGSNIRLFEYAIRAGKSSVLNKTILNASGQLVVFSDANSIFCRDAIQNLVKHFTDSKVGVVCGELRLQVDNVEQQSEHTYWNYEAFLKKHESNLGMLLGANGAIYAIRRELYREIPASTIIDDFLIPMKIVENRYKSIYEPSAVAYEEAGKNVQVEFKRRIRIASGCYHVLGLTRRMLYPSFGRIAFSYWSHKVVRWHVPFLLGLLLVTSIIIAWRSWVGIIALGLQLLLILAAIIGALFQKTRKRKLILFSYFYVFMNLAILIGYFRYFTKKAKPFWERTVRE